MQYLMQASALCHIMSTAMSENLYNLCEKTFNTPIGILY